MNVRADPAADRPGQRLRSRAPRSSSPPTPARARPRPWSTGWRGCCCAGARPEAILCVTYTKAAAAEMQRRLFERAGRLGGDGGRARWPTKLAELDEADARPVRGPRPVRPRPGDAGRAEDPDHPRLLREAAAALPAGGRRLARLHGAGRRRRPREVSAQAREDVARRRPGRPRRPDRPRPTPTSRSSWTSARFNDMFAAFEAERAARSRPMSRRCGGDGVGARHLARAAASTGPTPPEAIEAEAVARDPLEPVAARGRGAAGRARRPPTSALRPAHAARSTPDRRSPTSGRSSPPQAGEPRKRLGDQGGRCPRPRTGWSTSRRGSAQARERCQGGADRRGHRPRPQPGARLRRSSTRRPRTRRGGARFRRPDRAHPRRC